MDMTRLLHEGARRYAAADKSDPFAYSRAMSHIASGSASYDKERNPDYWADDAFETRRLPNRRDGTLGEEYTVNVYKNRRRA